MERFLDTLMLFVFLMVTIWHYGTHYLGVNFSILNDILFNPFFLCFLLFLHKKTRNIIVKEQMCCMNI